jgi:hypothetical protein
MATLAHWWESLIHWWDTVKIGFPWLPHLTQAELASWVSAFATLAAVEVALWLARSDRRARDVAQARLVTVTVHYRDYTPPSDRNMGRYWP